MKAYKMKLFDRSQLTFWLAEIDRFANKIRPVVATHWVVL
jgi:hypothetical protein